MPNHEVISITPIQGKKINYRKKRLIGIMVSTAIVKGLLWGCLLLVLFKLVPTALLVFNDFGVDLPVMTKKTILLSYLVNHYKHISVPIIWFLYVVDLAITYRLYRQSGRMGLKTLWKIVSFIFPVCLLIIMILAMLQSFPKVDFTLS